MVFSRWVFCPSWFCVEFTRLASNRGSRIAAAPTPGASAARTADMYSDWQLVSSRLSSASDVFRRPMVEWCVCSQRGVVVSSVRSKVGQVHCRQRHGVVQDVVHGETELKHVGLPHDADASVSEVVAGGCRVVMHKFQVRNVQDRLRGVFGCWSAGFTAHGDEVPSFARTATAAASRDAGAGAAAWFEYWGWSWLKSQWILNCMQLMQSGFVSSHCLYCQPLVFLQRKDDSHLDSALLAEGDVMIMKRRAANLSTWSPLSNTNRNRWRDHGNKKKHTLDH